MEDINYNELFGIETEDFGNGALGEKEEEVAEPSSYSEVDSESAGRSLEEDSSYEEKLSEGTSEGSVEGSVEDDAGPLDDEDTDGKGGDKADNIGDDGKNSDKETKRRSDEQSPEVRAGFAAARRRAESESEAKIAKALEKNRAENDRLVENILRVTGFSDPYTGEPIKTREEYEKYVKDRFNEEKDSFLKRSGMSKDEFTAVIRDLPEIKALEERAAAAEAQVEKIAHENVKKSIDAQIKKISAFEPRVKSLEDVTKLECYPELYEKVKRGYSIEDAYYIVNREAIEEKRTARRVKSALSSQTSKEHLTKTTSKGVGAEAPPYEVTRAYRVFNPDATDSDIARHWASYNKK